MNVLDFTRSFFALGSEMGAELGFLPGFHLFVAERAANHAQSPAVRVLFEIGARADGAHAQTPPESKTGTESVEAGSLKD